MMCGCKGKFEAYLRRENLKKVGSDPTILWLLFQAYAMLTAVEIPFSDFARPKRVLHGRSSRHSREAFLHRHVIARRVTLR